MDLKEYIKTLVRELLDEESTSADAGAYLSPKAFAKKGQKSNAAIETAKSQDMKLAPTGMPSDSKIRDYKAIWKSAEKPKYKIYKESFESMSTEEAANQLKPLLSHTIHHDKLSGDFNEWFNKVKEGDDDILDKMWNLTGSSIDRYAINILSKPKTMQESLKDIIKQELLNEATYKQFKKEVKFRTKAEQLHKAMREVKKKINEIDRIVEYTQRMKQELSEGDGVQYWGRTEKAVAQISEMVNHLTNKINNLKQ